MAKKNKRAPETTIENYYDLKVDKVDELVAALKDDGAQFDNEISMDIADCTGEESPDTLTRSGKRKQFDPYRNDFLSKIPVWLKAIFIKFWFAGMVCYFVVSGLQIGDTLDRVVLTGAVMGLVVDVLVNPLFRYLETDRHEYDAYMLFPFPFKAYWTFFTNIIYYVLVIFGVSLIYTLINEVTSLAVESLLFGVFTVAVDMIFIGIKDLIVFLVKRAKKKGEAVNV